VLYRDGRPVDPAALSRMSEAMRQRGPDDEGAFAAPGVGLVHRRLSIIDLSALGRCPMPNEDGSVQVVHNGEIYNFETLREDLVHRGHRFRSHCDTEVLVHGYEEWGSAVAERIDGMFAFAVWDARRRCLFLARDRLGEKPLYYLEFRDGLAFASSLNALAAYFAYDLEPNLDAVDCFLCHAFIPSPHTVWRGVQSLPPAHYAELKLGEALHVERYWDFPDVGARCGVSVREAEGLVEEALERSVRARLIADVPVGGFLSGGVDSSLVMALAARHSASLDTFSIGFAEEDFSELPYAQKVAERIGSSHHELIVDERDLFSVVTELVWQYGQPFGDSSAIPTHLVSRFARGTVKVSLSGDGGDESFAGYWRAVAGWYASLFRSALPGTVRREIIPRLCARLGERFGGIPARLAALNHLSLAPPGAGYTNALTWFNHRDELLGDAFAGAAISPGAGHAPIVCRTGRSLPAAGLTDLQQILYDDFMVLLPDDYLVKVDVASMGASLEVRPPFLDHHFIEAAWALPDSFKLRRGATKWLLKRVAARHVPRSVVYRKKSGFALPMKYWWRRGLADVLGKLLHESRCVARGWIRPAPVERALADHVAGRAEHDVRLWLVLWLELWARIVLERSLPRGVSLVDVA